jgi:hypothetical protein
MKTIIEYIIKLLMVTKNGMNMIKITIKYILKKSKHPLMIGLWIESR